MSKWKEVEAIKQEISFAETDGSARKWWLTFELVNNARPELVLRLLEEIRQRKVSITDFFLAYVHSQTENIQSNLEFLDQALKVVGDRRPLTDTDFKGLRQ